MRVWTPVSAALLGSGLAGAASAVELTPVSQARNALSGYRADVVATDFGPLDVTNRHVSSIGTQSLSADLQTEGGFVSEFGETEGFGESATFQLDFTIDEDARFDLSGSLDGTSNDVDGWTSAAASVALRSYDASSMSYQTIFEDVASMQLAFPPISVVFDETGVLAAGQYQVFLQSTAQAFYHSQNGEFWSDSTAQLAFGLTALPEPGTGLLLALALGVLVKSTHRASARP